jgi:hypothetical protein
LRFEYYTDLTPARCASAIKGRMEQSETASRPAMTGKVDKTGFSVTITTPVIRDFKRSTGIKATFERDKGTTVIQGYVNTGAPRRQQIMIFIGGLLVGLALIAGGMFIQGVVVIAIGSFFWIPLQGDSQNSEYLIKQMRTLLKAKTRDPR